MGPYLSAKDFNGSLCVPYKFSCIIAGDYSFLSVLTNSNWSFRVNIGPYLSLMISNKSLVGPL